MASNVVLYINREHNDRLALNLYNVTRWLVLFCDKSQGSAVLQHY